MSTKDINWAGRCKTNGGGCVNDVGDRLDDVPSNFMNEADRNQGASRGDPFAGIEFVTEEINPECPQTTSDQDPTGGPSIWRGSTDVSGHAQ